jgi:hypothetical protein
LAARQAFERREGIFEQIVSLGDKRFFCIFHENVQQSF